MHCSEFTFIQNDHSRMFDCQGCLRARIDKELNEKNGTYTHNTLFIYKRTI